MGRIGNRIGLLAALMLTALLFAVPYSKGATVIGQSKFSNFSSGVMSSLAGKVSQSHFTAYSTSRAATPPGSASWGTISGTLSSQTDLQGALNAKMTAAVFNNYTSIDRVTTSDSRLTDSRTPTTHSNTSHSETYITAAGVPVEKDTTAVTGILKGNGSVISAATAGTDYQAVLYKIYKVSGSDFTSSLNSAVTVTGLSWSIAANEEQNFDCILNTTNTATSLFRFGVNGPASPTAVSVTYSYRSTAYGTEVVNAAGAFTATVTTAAVTSSVLTTPLPFHIRGIVKNGSNAGTIAINATASTNGQTGTVRTGSMCRVW